MKNVVKVTEALIEAFPGHHVVSRCIEGNYSTESVFIDGKCVGLFYEDFLQKDFDNPEIEITIKAPLYNIKEFLEEVECDGVFYHAVERGLKEWQEESQRNS